MSKRKLQRVAELSAAKEFEESGGLELEEVELLNVKKSKTDTTEDALALVAALKRKIEEENGQKQRRFYNKQRVMVLCSRGTTTRHRHLIKDLRQLLPHSKKDVKIETKNSSQTINEVCELRSCNNCIFFEMRKGTDCFMWVAKTPSGPSVRFHLSNIHTLGELKLIGNCLLGSRPLLVFDKNFDEGAPHWKLIKEMLQQAFGTPRGHPKSKPFTDHVFSFFVQDNRIWFRHYQIAEKDADKKKSETELVEIGPRFVLNPVRIFAGSFGGPTLYQNGEYLASVELAKMEQLQKAGKYVNRTVTSKKLQARKAEVLEQPEDPLDGVFEE